MAPEAGWIEGKHERDALVFNAGGAWSIRELARLVRDVRAALPARAALGGRTRARIDLNRLSFLDSSGAWLVADTKRRLETMGVATEIVVGRAADRALLDRVEKSLARIGTLKAPARTHPILAALGNVGQIVIDGGKKGVELLSFFGLTLVLIVRAMAAPWRIHFTAVFKHLETTGLNALGRVRLRTTTPLLYDPYRVNRATGSFILVDEATNATVAAGMLLNEP